MICDGGYLLYMCCAAHTLVATLVCNVYLFYKCWFIIAKLAQITVHDDDMCVYYMRVCTWT